VEVVAVGMNYRTAPVGVLERVGVAPSSYGEFLRRLKSAAELPEAAALCTCNRSEVYAACGDPDLAIERIERFLVRESGLPDEEVLPRLYRKKSREAVIHLLRVAASLDSMVLGETQIQAQVKEAVTRASLAETAGPVLQRLFQAALRAGKRARSETPLGRLTVSISSTAVDLAARALGGLKGRSALVVGAGETARLAVPHLKRKGASPVRVASRTLERARRLAERFRASALPYERIGEALVESDTVFVATSAPHYIVNWPEVEEAMYRRRDKPMFIVDMSVPRNVDPCVGDIPNVHLCNVDDLETIAAVNRNKRREAAAEAGRIVEEEADAFELWLHGRRALATLRALREKIEAIASEEEKKVLRKLSGSSEKELFARFSRSLVRKILHTPTLKLRQCADPDLRARLADAARVLFDLGEVAESDGNEGKGDKARRAGD